MPPLPWTQAVARGVSADGSVMVGGFAGPLAGVDGAAFRRATNAAGFEVLPALAPDRDEYAVAVSADGRVIVGSAQNEGANYFRAVRWIDGRTPEDLGVLPGYVQSDAFGVSEDGRIVVGACWNSADKAFLYSDLTGLVDLQAFLVSRGVDLLGWTLESCFDVSADGSVLVGKGRGPGGVEGAWRADLAGLLCQANCDTSSTQPILNVADLTCFLQRYAVGDPYANCDQSTQVPVLNVADFTCFLQQFAAGCP
jgi:probable HAF family extracellular repeat protein